jgi:hypothetical protein
MMWLLGFEALWKRAAGRGMRGGAAIRRFFSLHGRRFAVLRRGLAGPGRRVRLPKRSIV